MDTAVKKTEVLRVATAALLRIGNCSDLGIELSDRSADLPSSSREGGIRKAVPLPLIATTER